MRFHPMLLFADDIFPSDFLAEIISDTVTRETSASWAASATEAPAKRATTITPLSKSLRDPLAAIIVGNRPVKQFYTWP